MGGISGPDRRAIVTLMAGMFIGGADLLVINPTLPQICRDIGVDVEVGGLWVTAYALATALFALIFGPISDRFGRRPVLVAGQMALAVGTLACGMADSFTELFVARFIAGAGAGMAVTSNTSYVADHFEPGPRAVAMGWVMTGFFLSLILAVPIGAFLADQLGWRNMFWVLAAASAAVGVATLVALPKPRFEQRAAALGIASSIRTYAGMLREGPVVGVLCQSASVGISMTMFSVFTSPWLEATYGMDTLDRGLMYMAGGPALLVGGPLSGRLANRLGRIPVILLGTVSMATMLSLMPFSSFLASEGLASAGTGAWNLPARWWAALPTLALFFGAMASGSLRSGPFFTLAVEVVEPQRRGAISALRNTFNHTGSAIGASLGGLLWAHAPAKYTAICWTAAAVTLLGVLLLRTLTAQKTSTPEPTGHAAREGSY